MVNIIDSHVHCGKLSGPSFQEYLAHVSHLPINAAVVFSSVSEIYDRNNPNFRDDGKWQSNRRQVNKHILSLADANDDFKVHPFFFVWNDFALEQSAPFVGIKWHRHRNEPSYDYESLKCKKFIAEIQRRNLPVVLEEEFENTLLFINELTPETIIIIPHCGLLNGGYEELCKSGIWEKTNIYADTALAGSEIIDDFISRYGYEKLIFGSDFPFGDPIWELGRVSNLKISEKKKEAILSLNVARLIDQVKR